MGAQISPDSRPLESDSSSYAQVKRAALFTQPDSSARPEDPKPQRETQEQANCFPPQLAGLAILWLIIRRRTNGTGGAETGMQASCIFSSLSLKLSTVQLPAQWCGSHLQAAAAIAPKLRGGKIPPRLAGEPNLIELSRSLNVANIWELKLQQTQPARRQGSASFLAAKQHHFLKRGPRRASESICPPEYLASGWFLLAGQP